ncbi:PqiC family protein [Pseudomonas tolaasii]|uniref:PqiC family protein n=1 Tax=Pseudomonas tolaasii TaxID=29442 RepID=UPI0002F66119|nr:PqiC family protein [Pseudomonas tolaasii]
MTLRSLALLATLGLEACSSAPTHYYTLVPAALEQRQTVVAPAFQFEMLGVRMPVQVDQPQIVVRQSGGGLMILETERWGAPLADEFHDALVGQLELKLGTRNLAGLPKADDKPVVSLQIDVRRFDSLPGQHSLIDVVWSLSQRRQGQKRRNLICNSVIQMPTDEGMGSLVLAHQKAIGQLASQVSRAARDWACPV